MGRYNKAMQRKLIALLFATAVFAAVPAFAQTDFNSALTIVPNPLYPTPNATVQLTAQSPLLDLSNSDVEWSVDGAPAGSGKTTTVKLGGLGTRTTIDVSVSGATGNDSAELTLI